MTFRCGRSVSGLLFLVAVLAVPLLSGSAAASAVTSRRLCWTAVFSQSAAVHLLALRLLRSSQLASGRNRRLFCRRPKKPFVASGKGKERQKGKSWGRSK